MYRIFVLCLLLLSCGRGDGYVRLDGFGLGTSWVVTARGGDVTTEGVDSVLRVVEGSLSVYDAGSLLSRLNRGQTDSVDRHVARCMDVAHRVSEVSGGVYDVTLRPVALALGFNEAEAAEGLDIDSLMQAVGYRKIRIVEGRMVKEDPRVQIDLNSVAKGYAVDLVAEFLEGCGATDFMVEVGGEIVCRGRNPRGGKWRIGIDKPEWGNFSPGARRQAVIVLNGGALATSGNYRRFRTDSTGRRTVHTISGRTGRGEPTDMLSATVVAADCATADAFATMFMAVGATRAIEILSRETGVKACFVYGDGEVFVSPGLDVKQARHE